MALAKKLADGKRPSGLPCSVQLLLDSLSEEDRANLNGWLYELGYSQEVIYAELKADGHIVGKQTINRHRARACRCFL